MTVEPFIHGWRIYDIVNGHLVTRRYIGFSKREAIKEFKRELKQGRIK